MTTSNRNYSQGPDLNEPGQANNTLDPPFQMRLSPTLSLVHLSLYKEFVTGVRAELPLKVMALCFHDLPLHVNFLMLRLILDWTR